VGKSEHLKLFRDNLTVLWIRIHIILVTWIRIRIKKSGFRSASNKIQDPDPHPGDKLDPEPDPHQFADDKPKCMEYEPIRVLFMGLSLYLEAII
jgi:hypothetical protein